MKNIFKYCVYKGKSKIRKFQNKVFIKGLGSISDLEIFYGMTGKACNMGHGKWDFRPSGANISFTVNKKDLYFPSYE